MPKLLLEANGIIVEFGVRRVLDIDRIRIYDGERVGLIGENGAGKTTLLDVLSGTRTPDSGVVSRYGELAMICQLGNGESAENAEIRARFSAQDVREGLSGGEMTRRRIAAALSKRAPLLLADEPTTDLDAEGVQELTAELSHYEGAIVLVSHDRGLLDALCTRILHLEDGKITDFPGNYTEYRAELERRRAFQQFEYDQYRGEQARLRASIQDNRERSSQRRKPSERWGNSEARLHKMDGRQNSEKYHKARRQMESRLNHMKVKTRPREDIAITMALGASNPVSAKTILEVRYLSLRAGDKPLLKNESFRLPTGSRTALVGANGCGKTTLMRAIAAKAAEEGKLENQNTILGESPDRAIRFNPAARVGWFDQTHERTLNPEWSALENILSETEAPESDVRTVLARLGIRGDDVFKPARVLSGGERGRVALAKLLMGSANLLLLDEPTNHLDVFTLEALQELLSTYQGTILFVSHDSAFRDAVATRMIEFDSGKLAAFEGGAAEKNARENADRSREAIDTEISVLQMRMAVVAARMSAPKKGDSPEKLNEEYLALAEALRKRKNSLI